MNKRIGAALALALMLPAAPAGRGLQAVSLALTHAAGLNAIAFWALRGEFDPAWWLPNLWLVLFPVAALVVLLGCPATPPLRPAGSGAGRR